MDNKKRTLIELIIKNIVEMRRKKRTSNKSKNNNIKNKSGYSISSLLINLKINEAISETKGELGEENFEEIIEEESEDKDQKTINGGYGTVKTYSGMSSQVKYADYNKIWSHIGAFRTYNMFDKDSSGDHATLNGESSRSMVSDETLNMGARQFKYSGNHNINNTVQDMMTITSLVVPPGAGVDSVEWEKYMLMMKMSIYQPILALKFKFA